MFPDFIENNGKYSDKTLRSLQILTNISLQSQSTFFAIKIFRKKSLSSFPLAFCIFFFFQNLNPWKNYKVFCWSRLKHRKWFHGISFFHARLYRMTVGSEHGVIPLSIKKWQRKLWLFLLHSFVVYNYFLMHAWIILYSHTFCYILL